ncbi:hypothetical protein ACWPM1_13090 [Tsuneonella sp. HG249]
MAAAVSSIEAFVLKAEELPALNYLPKGSPRPLDLVWINRGTNQELRPTTVQMLLRTLFQNPGSPSINKLHRSSGLRAIFRTARDREAFARSFEHARTVLLQRQRSEMTAVFATPHAAARGFRELEKAGVNPRSISILWRAGQFIQSKHNEPLGHSKMSVAAVSAGAGLAGAIFGISMLTIPGLGLVAAGGAIAAQAIGTIGAVGGALGASGGGIARMLTDIDVDGKAIPFYEMEIESGKVFIAVDPATCDRSPDVVRGILEENGGHIAPNLSPNRS